MARRIRIYLEAWARNSLEDQEAAIGRKKVSGRAARRTGTVRPARPGRLGPGGLPVIPGSAHIRLASAANNGGAKILRRSYNFADGGGPDDRRAGRRPLLHLLPARPGPGVRADPAALAAGDSLSGGYLLHTSSAVFACPPGIAEGAHWGQALGLD